MSNDSTPQKHLILKSLAGDLVAALASATGSLGLVLLVVKYLSAGKWQDALFAVALTFFFVVALYRIGTKRVEVAIAAKDSEIKALREKNAALRACLPKPMSAGQHATKLKLKRGLEALRSGAADLYAQVARGFAQGDVKYGGSELRQMQYKLVPPGAAAPSNLAVLWNLFDAACWWWESLMVRWQQSRSPQPHQVRAVIDKDAEQTAAANHRDEIIREIDEIMKREGLVGLPDALPPEPPPE